MLLMRLLLNGPGRSHRVVIMQAEGGACTLTPESKVGADAAAFLAVAILSSSKLEPHRAALTLCYLFYNYALSKCHVLLVPLLAECGLLRKFERGFGDYGNTPSTSVIIVVALRFDVCFLYDSLEEDSLRAYAQRKC